MPEPRPEVLEFLLTRRSRPAKTLAPPAPAPAELDILLRAAVRVPDHGKLEPWRFVVLTGPALARIGAAVRARGAERGERAEALEKLAGGFERAPLIVAVVAVPKPSATIPEIEQTLSAGAVCLSLVNAALAAGWGANWLSGWPARDAVFLGPALGLGPGEWVAGFVHIGSQTAVPPERPRPDLPALVEWVVE
jgi:nitroreductase